MTVDISNQRIARLTPLSDVLALIGSRVAPVLPQNVALHDGARCILAEDILGAERPAHASALRDGFAVAAATVADATPYSPTALASKPHRIDAGDPMPDDTDAVAQFDSIIFRGQAVAAI